MRRDVVLREWAYLLIYFSVLAAAEPRISLTLAPDSQRAENFYSQRLLVTQLTILFSAHPEWNS
jgi:hypothetical protein